MFSVVSKRVQGAVQRIFLGHSQSYSETLNELNKAHDYETRFNQCLSDHTHQQCDKNDARNAVWFYLRAALRGDKEAQYKMGLSYLNGQLGLDRSYIHAEKWLDQAAEQGHHDAKHVLEKALNHLVIS